MNEIIRCDQIEKRYQLGTTVVPALRGITCSVSPGEFAAIAGPSGSGKTTLLNLIGCLDKPDSGRLYLDGNDVTPLGLNKLASLRRSRLGFVFQTFNLIPVLSAYENVEYPLLLDSVSSKDRRSRVMGMLDAVGLLHRRNHRPNRLSGGERQRVAIARALVTRPAVVLADEPTANLDSRTGEEIVQLMRQLNRDLKVTFLFSTHDARILHNADLVLNLEDGQVVGHSSTLRQEAGKEAYV
jgi:putative ABC transport system ATP-binding protein